MEKDGSDRESSLLLFCFWLIISGKLMLAVAFWITDSRSCQRFIQSCSIAMFNPRHIRSDYKKFHWLFSGIKGFYFLLCFGGKNTTVITFCSVKYKMTSSLTFSTYFLFLSPPFRSYSSNSCVNLSRCFISMYRWWNFRCRSIYFSVYQVYVLTIIYFTFPLFLSTEW